MEYNMASGSRVTDFGQTMEETHGGSSPSNEGEAQVKHEQQEVMRSSKRKRKAKKTRPVDLVVEDSYSRDSNKDDSIKKRKKTESCSRDKRKRNKSIRHVVEEESLDDKAEESDNEDSDISALNNMAQGLDFALNSMVQLLLKPGVNEYQLFQRQVKLLLQSLRIRKTYLILTLKLLNEDYDSEQEERESLKKISDLQVEHVQLITNALTSLINSGSQDS